MSAILLVSAIASCRYLLSTCCRLNLAIRGFKHAGVANDLLVSSFADIMELRRSDVESSTYFLDTRAATDPESRQYAGHTGEHFMIMACVADVAVQYRWFSQLRSILHHMVNTRSGDIMLVLYCKQGKHRSVAMAFLLYEVLRRCSAYAPSTPIGFTPWGSLASCRGAPSCPSCSARDHPVRSQAVTDCINQWNMAEDFQ